MTWNRCKVHITQDYVNGVKKIPMLNEIQRSKKHKDIHLKNTVSSDFMNNFFEAFKN